MNMKTSSDAQAKHVAKQIGATKSADSGILSGIWHWIDGVANSVTRLFDNHIVTGFKVVLATLENVRKTLDDHLDAIRRLAFWWPILLWHVVKGAEAKEQRRTTAAIRAMACHLLRIIYVATNTVLALAMHAIRRERDERIKSVKQAEHRARAEVRALHQVIEREAASGYSADDHTRVSLIIKLLEFAATRVPAVRTIVGDIATALLDLLTIDDPIARIGLGFLIKHVIDKLGIDKAVGALIDDLMAPFIGAPKPRNLHDVIMDISKRLGAMEGQWSTFMQDGGSQVEQAGKDWRNITSVAASLAIVGFTVQAVVDPQGWADEISGTVGVVANDLTLKAVKLFGG